MSKTILLNHSNWHFTKENPGIPAAVMGEAVALPHTWNAVDGQDGGNDYYRGTCWYTLALTKPAIPAGGKAVLQLDGAAMTAAVYLNGEKLAEHKGGYSTFRVDLTDHLKDENLLAISVDNRDNDTVQFQTALSKIRDIVAASAREPGDTTVGLLAAITTATDRRGTDIVRAGTQLRRITSEINAVMTPNGPSLLDGLTESVTALRKAAPDLLDALHSSVVPMQTVAAQSNQLQTLLSGGITTAGRIDVAMRNNATILKKITSEAAPIADVVGRGGYSFTS